MIRFLKHDQIDKIKWDASINRAVNGNLYAWSWFLDIVNPEWCALVEDDYMRVFPLTVYSKAGINYVRQPYFTQQLGIFYQTFLTQEIINDFLTSIPQTYKFIHIYLNTSSRIDSLGKDFDMTNLELDLISDYDTISRSYSSNLQRNLKKAAKQSLSVSKHVRPEEIVSLFQKNKGKEIAHLDESSYQLIQRIAYTTISNGTGEIWGTYDEYNQLLAGALWIKSHQKTIFFFSSVSQDGKKANAMPFLIDSFIRENAGSPLTLDFEGSNDIGLARFYSGFGAQKVLYQKYIHNKLPLVLRPAMQLWQFTNKQIKKLI